jgi:hypothetical protein
MDDDDDDDYAYIFDPPFFGQDHQDFEDYYDSDATEIDEPPAEEPSLETVFDTELTEAEARSRAPPRPGAPDEPLDVHVVRNAVQLYLESKASALRMRKHSALLESAHAESYRTGFKPPDGPAPSSDDQPTQVANVLPKMTVQHTTTVLTRNSTENDPSSPFQIKVRDGTYFGPVLLVEIETGEQLDEWNRRTGRADKLATNAAMQLLPLRFPESFATAQTHTVGVLNYNGNVLAAQGGRVTPNTLFLSKTTKEISDSLAANRNALSCAAMGFDGAVLRRLHLMFSNDQYVGPMHLGNRDTSTDTSGWVVRTRVGDDNDPNGGCHVPGTHYFSTMKQLPASVQWPSTEQLNNPVFKDRTAEALAKYLPGGFQMQSDGGALPVFSEGYHFALRCDWKDNMPVSSSDSPATLLSPFGVFDLQFLDRYGQIAPVDTAVGVVAKLTFMGGLHVFDPAIHPLNFQATGVGQVQKCTGTWMSAPGAYFRPHAESGATVDLHVQSEQLKPLAVLGHTDYATTLALGEPVAPAAPRSMFSARNLLDKSADGTTALRRCGEEALAAVRELFAASDPRMHGQSVKTAAYLAPPVQTDTSFHGLVNEPWGRIEPVAVFEIDYAHDSPVSTRYRAATERVAGELGESVDPSKNTHQCVAADLDRRVLPTQMRTLENPRGTHDAPDAFFVGNANDPGVPLEFDDHEKRFHLANASPDDMDTGNATWKQKSDAAGSLTMNVFTRTRAPLERACAAEREVFEADVTAANADPSETRMADGATWGLAPLRAELNETLLLHGVRAADVKDAIESGLDVRFHTSGAFGEGVYLCEDAFAADHDAGLFSEGSAAQHAGPRPTAQCPRRTGEDRALAAALGIIPELHLGNAASSHLDEQEVERSKSTGAPSELDGCGDLFYALVVRTTLGAPAVVTEAQVKKNCVGGAHTTFDEDFERAARDKSGPSGAELFVPNRSVDPTKLRLRKGLHSLVGFGSGSVDDSGFGARTSGAGINNGGQVATHRSFVVPVLDDQLAVAVKPVMLIAYKRVKAMPAEFGRTALGQATLERPIADPFAPPDFPIESWRDHFLQFPTFYQYMRTTVADTSRRGGNYADVEAREARFRSVDRRIYTPVAERAWGRALTDAEPRSGMCPTKGVLFAKDGTPNVPMALGCH